MEVLFPKYHRDVMLKMFEIPSTHRPGGISGDVFSGRKKYKWKGKRGKCKIKERKKETEIEIKSNACEIGINKVVNFDVSGGRGIFIDS